MNSQYIQNLFKVEIKLLKFACNVKFNYKNDQQNSRELWKCDSCQSSIETQDHVLWCPAYATIREDKDISNDNDLANYLKQVLIIRDKLNLTK